MQLIMLFVMWNLAETGSVYQLLKNQLLVEDRSKITMCTAITMMSSLVLALHIEVLLPANPKVLYLLPVFIGVFIGWTFGGLVNHPASLLTGLYNGAMGGIMGKMLGAVLQNPALCNIPITSQTMIDLNTYSLVIFTACLHVLICHLIRYFFNSLDASYLKREKGRVR